MAAVTKLQISPYSLHPQTHHRAARWPPRRLQFVSFSGRRGVYLRPCRSFRSGDGGELEEQEKESVRKGGNLKENRVEAKEGLGILSFAKSVFVRVSSSLPRTEEEHRNAVAKLEEIFSSVSCNLHVIIYFCGKDVAGICNWILCVLFWWFTVI